MRSVTVRVSEAGDWQFRAERADGQLLFALEFTEGSQAQPAAPASPSGDGPSPEPETESKLELPYHLGDFGMGVGPEDDHWNTELFTLRDTVELALPAFKGARVAEIGAGSTETTVAYSRQWTGAELFLIDPDLEVFGVDPDPWAANCRKHNEQYLEATTIPGDALITAKTVDRQDLALLIISPVLTRDQQAQLLDQWLRHMRPSGNVILRMPADRTPLKIGRMEVHQAGEWLLYSPPAKEVASE